MSESDRLASAGRWFDRDWYLARNPDVVRAGLDPVAHYLRYGEAEGRFPSPWFDPGWYRATYGISADQCALEHFLIHRGTGLFLPCPELYLVPRCQPWRDASSADPFDRYLGDTESPPRELVPDLPLIQASGLIDTTYFRINPLGAFEADLDPALHYCQFGWQRGLRPSTAFDPEWYAETNQIVPRLRINPLTHYILEGEPNDRRPAPWFDPAWYRSQYYIPSGQGALAHYLLHRHGKTVSPNPLFDVDWYVATHGDAMPPDGDPFSHYLLSGAISDIDPSPAFNARAWRHRHMAPLGAEGQSRLPISARNPLVHHLRCVRQAGSE